MEDLNTWQNTVEIEETCYDSITLGLIKERNLILGLTQENLMEFLVQDIYLYILTSSSLYATISSLP